MATTPTGTRHLSKPRPPITCESHRMARPEAFGLRSAVDQSSRTVQPRACPTQRNIATGPRREAAACRAARALALVPLRPATLHTQKLSRSPQTCPQTQQPPTKHAGQQPVHMQRGDNHPYLMAGALSVIEPPGACASAKVVLAVGLCMCRLGAARCSVGRSSRTSREACCGSRQPRRASGCTALSTSVRGLGSRRPLPSSRHRRRQRLALQRAAPAHCG